MEHLNIIARPVLYTDDDETQDYVWNFKLQCIFCLSIYMVSKVKHSLTYFSKKKTDELSQRKLILVTIMIIDITSTIYSNY